LGDEGSGYDIARQGLRAVVRAFDGRAPQTALTEKVCQHLGIHDVPDLVEVVYRRGWTAKDLAALAPLVDAIAAQGDAVAMQIMEDAASELAAATLAVGRRLFAPKTPFDVVAVGGAWHGRSDLYSRFQRQLRQRHEGVTVIAPRYEAAYGAVLMALRAIGWH
jgi:N-acetylglucosamine kinase